MLKPIFFENDNLLIHSFRPIDLLNLKQLSEEVLCVLSDDRTLKYIPEKRLCTIEQADLFLRTMIINYHASRNYIHFIKDKNLNKVIGMIDLITPKVAMEFYKIDHYPFFIEFYLSSYSSGCYVMTEILPNVIGSLFNQGINSLGAVVDRNNIAAKKVLEKSKFCYKGQFDILQDFYELNYLA